MAPRGYLCCFCEKDISRKDEDTSVALAALNMRDWSRDLVKPRSEMLWAHMDCLTKTWPGREGWDAEYLTGPAK